MYAQEVKRATDSFLGVPSQCFVSQKAGIAAPAKLRGRQQYTANLAMKINAKQGGTNVALGDHALPTWTKQSDFMVFGALATLTRQKLGCCRCLAAVQLLRLCSILPVSA